MSVSNMYSRCHHPFQTSQCSIGSFEYFLTCDSLIYMHCNNLNYEFLRFLLSKVSKGANIRNQYNQVPHLTQDTNGKVTNSQLDTTNESQDVSLFQAGDYKAQKDAHKGITNKRQKKHTRSTKEVPPWNGQ